MAKYIAGVVPYNSKAHLKRVLSAAKLDQPHLARVTATGISETLNALLELHDEADEKIGVGIDHWVVFDNSVDTLYTSTGFRPVRVDGSGPVKFSYRDVIDKPTHRQNAQEALTLEATSITLGWRQDQFAAGPVECVRTGELIGHYKDAQAIHLNPQRRVLHSQFLESEGLTLETVGLEKHPTDSGYRLQDRGLADRWLQFQTDHLDGMAIAKLLK